MLFIVRASVLWTANMTWGISLARLTQITGMTGDGIWMAVQRCEVHRERADCQDYFRALDGLVRGDWSWVESLTCSIPIPKIRLVRRPVLVCGEFSSMPALALPDLEDDDERIEVEFFGETT